MSRRPGPSQEAFGRTFQPIRQMLDAFSYQGPHMFRDGLKEGGSRPCQSVSPTLDVPVLIPDARGRRESAFFDVGVSGYSALQRPVVSSYTGLGQWLYRRRVSLRRVLLRRVLLRGASGESRRVSGAGVR